MAGPYTMSELGTPSGAHTGLQVNAGVITISATTTAGAITYLCRVPDGCTIVDWCFFSDQITTIGGASQKVVIGTSLSNSCLGTFSLSGSASTDPVYRTGRFAPRGDQDLIPARVSLTSSDNTGANSSVWLTAKFEVAPSTSGTVVIAKFWVSYTNDGMVGHKKIA